jgi:prefoldin subunit 5
MGFFLRLTGGTARLAFKYVVVPIALGIAASVVADEVAKRMRHRTAELDSLLEDEARDRRRILAS